MITMDLFLLWVGAGYLTFILIARIDELTSIKPFFFDSVAVSFMISLVAWPIYIIWVTGLEEDVRL